MSVAADRGLDRLVGQAEALADGEVSSRELTERSLVDPDAVPDGLFGELLALIFQAFEALMRENPAAAEPGVTATSREAATPEKEPKDG